MGKKRYIDKRDPNTHTFSLVHRSQRDPLAADKEAPQRVLAPVSFGNRAGKQRAVDDDGVFDDIGEARKEQYDKKAELALSGIFYDDEYDYNQHLRERGAEDAEYIPADPEKMAKLSNLAGQSLELPADLLPSATEDDIGILNRNMPSSGIRLDWDPEIVAALDDALDLEDPENVLDDDFIIQAEIDQVEDAEEDDIDSEGSYDTVKDQEEILNDFKMNQYETQTNKSRFTEYSMTSSILPRTEILQRHDDHFENFFEQYDDEEIGDLEELDNVGGEADIDAYGHVLDEFLDQEMAYDASKLTLEDTEKTKNIVRSTAESEDEGDRDLEIVEYKDKPFNKDEDCETILSTRSTLYNHPTRIVEPSNRIKIDKKTGLPTSFQKDVALRKNKGNAETEESSSEDEEQEEKVNTAIGRSKVETAEEKKLRKKAIKEQRRGRREIKKATKTAFKTEEKRQKANLRSIPTIGPRITQIH
eukprot:m.30225 g.30225  ORF g.30225 m.30225 type:complete len:474 (+) comp8184_c0_seq1:236-1657(+)